MVSLYRCIYKRASVASITVLEHAKQPVSAPNKTKLRLPSRLSTEHLLRRPSQVAVALQQNIVPNSVRKLADGTMGVVTFVWGRGHTTDAHNPERRVSRASVATAESLTDLLSLDCERLSESPQLCLKYLDLSGNNEVVGTLIMSQFMNTPAFCFLSPKDDDIPHPIDPLVKRSQDDFILNNFFLSHADRAIPMLMEFLDGHNCCHDNVEDLATFFTPKPEELTDVSDLSHVKLYHLGMQAGADWLIHNTDRFRWGHLFHEAQHQHEGLSEAANLGNIFYDTELKDDSGRVTQSEQIRCIDNMICAFFYDTSVTVSQDDIKAAIQTYAHDLRFHLESLKQLPLDRISIAELQAANPRLVERVKALVFKSLDIPEPTDAMLYVFFRGLLDKAKEIGSPQGQEAINNAMVLMNRQIPGSTLDSISINVFSTPSGGTYISLREYLTPVMAAFTDAYSLAAS